MRYFATIDAEGRRTGTYTADHPSIPAGAFEIDEPTFREWIENDLTRRWDNGRLVECEPPAMPSPSPEEIAAARIENDPVLKGLVDLVGQKFAMAPAEVVAAITQRRNG